MKKKRLIDNGDGTSTVPLTQGFVSIIDTEDAMRVGSLNWHIKRASSRRQFYATAWDMRSDATKILLHRFLINAGDGVEVDHLNGNGLDNRKCNLRVARNSQNQANQQVVRGEVSFKGVRTSGNRFSSKITVCNKSIYLGTYATALQAALAYDAAAIKHFGEFAATNASLGLLESVQ